MYIANDPNGTATLIIKCKNKDGLDDLFDVLSDKFDVESSSQGYGTIRPSSPQKLTFTPYRESISDGVANLSSDDSVGSSSLLLKPKKKNGVKD